MKKQMLKQPKIFLCNNCKVFFVTFSQMQKPTHPKCFGHNTRLATNKEIDELNQKNKTSFCHNEVS